MNGNAKRLLKNARFIKKLIIHDQYFDRPDYHLTLADKWLRRRNDCFELKVPALPNSANSQFEARRYQELQQEEEIRHELNLPDSEDLPVVLAAAGYQAFAAFTTTRRSYQDGQFTIDIDQTNFGYAIGEIEIMVKDPTDAQAAEIQLHDHLAALGVSYTSGHIGKVAHYLQRHNPVHFCQLVEKAVISADKERQWCEAFHYLPTRRIKT